MSADDGRLIAAALAGSDSAFEELVLRYQDRLYHTIYRLLGHAEDAQDVVQETFLSAYQSLDGFKGESQFYTWLYRIAVNNAISYKRRRRPGLSLERMSQEDGMNDPADPSELSRPGFALERQEEEQTLMRALGQLSPDHRTVLVLKDLQGQKYEEMAEVLDVPVGTIRSRLHRARLELRELLARDPHELPTPGPSEDASPRP